MASYYPPTNYFQNINFNNDFYATPNNNQGVKLEYANTHYLFSTGVATSTAFTTFFSGSIGIGTVGGVAGSINALNINAINELQINGNIISNIYISSNVLPNILAPYDKIIDRQGAIFGLSNIYVSSNVIPNFLVTFDKIVDRQNAVTALSTIYISSNAIPNFTYILNESTFVGNSNTANIFGSAVIDILDPFSTTKNTTTRSLGGHNSSTARLYLGSGAYYSTAAVTSITVGPNSGSILAGSRFSLYGIR
jgi:hypothetical protein